MAMVILSCKDDDDAPLNEYTYNSVTKEIKTAFFSNNTDFGGYSFDLYPTVETSDPSENHATEFIQFDIPTERMNTTFPLNDDDPYEWSWELVYALLVDGNEKSYYGVGEPGEMGDIASGSITAKSTGTDVFAFTVDVVFTDGETLNMTFAGRMIEWGD
jgi:hypothetical protein